MGKAIVVIVGQTASGKTSLSIKMAKRFDGEVISADSRQVYRELNLCSGKVTEEEKQGVRHYLLDLVSAKDGVFTAQDFKKFFQKALDEIDSHGKLPIVAGGSGFYIDVALGKIKLDDIERDKALAEELNTKTTSELQGVLKDVTRQVPEGLDLNNKIKLIRAIEFAQQGKEFAFKRRSADIGRRILWIGIKWEKDILRKRIKTRLKERFEQGMCDEVRQLHKSGVSWERLDALGLEVRYCTQYIQGVLDQEAFLEVLENKIWQYAKRQATYWRQNPEIIWFDAEDTEQILRFTEENLHKN